MSTLTFDPDNASDAAMHIFWEKGYADTSMQDLVECTGLSRSSLYNTFNSKHELFERALRRYYEQTEANVRLLKKEGHAKILIREFLLSIVEDELNKNNACGCLVANTALEFGGRDKTVTRLLAEHFNALETALVALIIRGQNNGEILNDSDPKSLARFIVANIQGLRVVGKGYEDDIQSQRLLDIVEVAVSVL